MADKVLFSFPLRHTPQVYVLFLEGPIVMNLAVIKNCGRIAGGTIGNSNLFEHGRASGLQADREKHGEAQVS